MADFPCPSERIAASALLLLSTTTIPSISRSIFDIVIHNREWMGEESKIRSCQGSLVSSYSKSSSLSSSELSDVSLEGISEESSAISSRVPRRHEMNLKVVRKSRSKVQQVSGGWVYSSAGEGSSMTKSFRSVSESSCLTASATSSSADSSNGQSRIDGYAKRRTEKLSSSSSTVTRKLSIGSAHIRRRAEEIMRMLYEGPFTEVTIRQVLGDSPDTSKALRILLKVEKVKRSGSGGRVDPFIYKIAPKV